MSPGGGFAHPALTGAGLAALALAWAGATWAGLDARRVSGERVALKPTRFALSIGVYLLTVSWLLSFVRPDRLSSHLVVAAVAALLAGAVIELGCITLQAARGRRSHFNLDTPGDAAISGLMAVVAVLFIGALLPLAWEIARRPRPEAAPVMTGAVVAGLIATFVFGGLTGAGMGRAPASGLAKGGPPNARTGRRRKSVPARIAHALGVHALQAFPLMAAVGLLLRGWCALALPTAGALAYVAATLALMHRAGRAGAEAA